VTLCKIRDLSPKSRATRVRISCFLERHIRERGRGRGRLGGLKGRGGRGEECEKRRWSSPRGSQVESSAA